MEFDLGTQRLDEAELARCWRLHGSIILEALEGRLAILVVSDIHSNFLALEAVDQDAAARAAIDAVWCLGDVVGYGPDPVACIDFLVQRNAVCIAGNHDLAVAGLAPTSPFNPPALEAIVWTAEHLTTGEVAFLRALPFSLTFGPVTLIHASPRQPIWEYLSDARAAAENFPLFKTQACLVGHTHHPIAFFQNPASGTVRRRRLTPGSRTPLEGSSRFFYNPGSVGQPRDGDKRAAYAIYDPERATLAHYRVDYDVKETQRRMRAARLPAGLVNRLSWGR